MCQSKIIMRWFCVCICFLSYVNADHVDVAFTILGNKDGYDCSTHEPINVTSGQDVTLRISWLEHGLDFNETRCTIEPSNYTIKMEPSLTGGVWNGTVKNVRKKFSTTWKCTSRMWAFKQSEMYDVSCIVNVTVNDPNESIEEIRALSAAVNSDTGNKWVFIGVGIGVSVIIIIIIGQTACIIYFKRKAKIIRRNARLSTRAGCSSEDISNSEARYSSLPGRRKKKQSSEEGTYETVGFRRITNQGRENACVSPVLNRAPMPLPVSDEAPSSANCSPRPPSISSLPKKKKATALQSSNQVTPLQQRKKNAVPILSQTDKSQISQELEGIFKKIKESEGIVRGPPVPVKPISAVRNKIDVDHLSSNAPVAVFRAPHMACTITPRPSPQLKPKMLRNTTATDIPISSTPMTPIQQKKSKSFSNNPNSFASETGTEKPFKPPPKMNPPERPAKPFNITSAGHNIAVTRPVILPGASSVPFEATRMTPNTDLLPNPKATALHPRRLEPEPIQEEVYEPILEDFDSESEEDWNYEALPNYRIYNI